MQKALSEMNLHLHKVLTNITGLTGMRIIHAIIVPGSGRTWSISCNA